MGKEKRKTEELCDSCGGSVKNEDVVRHSEKTYCPECIVEHIQDEHGDSRMSRRRKAVDKDYSGIRGGTAEERRAWTYKSH